MRFAVGDLVRVKSYDDMVNEFGVDRHGNIVCEFTFTTEMKYLCGKEFSITEIDPHMCIHGLDERWDISADMIELVYDRWYDDDLAPDDLLDEDFISVLKGVNAKNEQV